MKCLGVAHFSIPVSDMDRSIKFYTDVVGCKLLVTDHKDHAFMDAGGVCLLLCGEPTPIVQSHFKDLVHHSFIVSPEDYENVKEHLEKHGAEVLYDEVREGGIVNGPRIYFRDPDGTRIELIKLTSYVNTPPKERAQAH